jgi:ABC-2 type transport system ATP-binding protein
MSNNDIALSIVGLTKSYGRVRALRGVDLDVKRGETVGFLGPNGAGKTTTIRCLLDLIRPQSGQMRVLGFDPQKDPVAVRRRVGYLPGELSLETNMRVAAALRYFSDLRGHSVNWDYTVELAERLQLDLTMPIKNLSKGNRQKVGVVQALMPRPELLLLDEPTSGLDPLMQQEVYRLLREARAEGATVFFSSHIIGEVEAIADRVAIIRQGAVVEEAKPSDLARLSMRRVRIRLQEPVDLAPLMALPRVSIVSQRNDTHVTLQVEGDMDQLIKTLSLFPVSDLQTDNPSLEEVFLTYYQDSIM